LQTEVMGTFPTAAPNQKIIEATRGWTSLGLHDLWEYRELVYFMVWREVQGRYRQTALGMSWLFLRPLVNVIVLSLVFGSLVRVPSDNLPYPLFSLTALLPWSYFATAVQRAAGSLVEQSHVISKVYFPRLVLPLGAVISGLVDFGAGCVVFLGALIVYRLPLRVEMLLAPAYLIIALGFALAVGLWLATLSVRYRDVSFAVNFLLQGLMYASPVIYPLSLVPERFRFLYQLNPMSGAIQGFRWALLGSGAPPGGAILVSILVLAMALLSGAYIFRRTERTIVDIL